MVLLMALTAQADEGAALYVERTAWTAHRGGVVAAIPESAYIAAASGTITSGLDGDPASGVSRAWGVGVLDAPIEAVWRGLTDMTGFADWMPVDFAKAIASGGQSGAVVFQYISLPLVSDRWWCVQQTHNPTLYSTSGGKAWELTWADQHNKPACSSLPAISEDGMSVKWSRGSWMLVDRGDGTTLAEYTISSHPGGNLPAEQLARFAASRVPATIAGVEALAKWKQSQPVANSYRPDGTPMQ
ncbi:MAG: hypothetical protein ACI8RZ_007289 [Myxococcota bacterium]|jgi:hypothetical protein